jgi:hypothetical protein
VVSGSIGSRIGVLSIASSWEGSTVDDIFNCSIVDR